MSHKHKSANYKSLDIPNPLAAGQDTAYADILLDKQKEVNLWRKSIFIIIALFFISLILFFTAINQQKTVPVLVNVMPSGESQYLGEVRQSGNIQVPEAAIHYQVRKFVTNVRSVSTDYQVVYNNIDDCFFMAASSYTPVMRQMLLSDSPFDHVGKIRRTVVIESVLNITAHSYSVNWTETVLDTSSSQKSSRYRAVVTIRLITPTDASIKKNPLGIYIENFEMTEL